MALVSSEVLHALDAATQLVGVAVGIGFVVHLCRNGRWRAPFPASANPLGEPSALLLAGVVLAYTFLLSAAIQLAGIDAKSLEASGSHEWHLAQTIDAIAKLVCSGAGLFFMLQARRNADPLAPGLRFGSLLFLAVAATLAIFPIAFSQLTAGKLLWLLLDPGAQQPRHTVLEAFEQSAWGSVGTVQLIVSAAVIAPIAEEVLFRGLLLGAVRRATGLDWPAILISSVLFGLVHLRQPQDVLPLVTMGVILAFVRLRYNSLLVCVLIHALFNARTLAFVLLNPEMARGF